jgi:hypothetical protein
MQAEWREMDCRIEAFNDEFATQACGSAWNFDPVTGVIGVQN